MDIAQQLGQQWSQRIANEHPEINAEVRDAIVKWLLGEFPEFLTGQTEPDLAIARQANEYRYRILQQRYWNVSPNEGYQRLIKRLSSLFLIRNKIKTWISLSRDRRRTVIDVIQEVIQEMMHSDRHLAQELEWISTCTQNSRLRNLLMLASVEEYCLRPIRNQPLIIYRFVHYLRRSQKGGMTQVPTEELIRLVSDEIAPNDTEDSLSLLDIEAWNQYQDEQTELEQQSHWHQVKNSFVNYLGRNLDDTATRWLELHLNGLSQEQIAQTLDMPVQQVYRLREKISYHAVRIFALREQLAMVLGWLKTSLQEHNFGLTPAQWDGFRDDLTDDQKQILEYFRQDRPVDEIAKRLSLTTSKVQSTLTVLYLQSQSLRSYYGDVVNEVEEVDKALDEHAVDEIEEVKTALDNILKRIELDYLVVMHFSSPKVRVGEEVKVSIDFWSVLGNLDCETRELKEGQIINFHNASDDLNLFLSAKNCLSLGDLTASLPSFNDVDKPSNTRHSVEFKVVPIFSGSSEVSVEIFDGKNFVTRIANILEVESLEEFTFISRLNNASLRPVAHSDFSLYVKSSNLPEGVVSLEFFLKNLHLKSFPREIYSVTKISKEWIDLSKKKIGDNIHSRSIFSCFEQETSLSSIGYEIFHRIVPLEIRECICSQKKYVYPFSMSIFSSRDTWLPWEILHDGKGFLSDLLIIGNWPLELDRDFPYEFPVGGTNISYYGSVTKPEDWERILSPAGSLPPLLLDDGTLAHLGQLESLKGLHIAQSSKLRDCANLEFPVSLTNLEGLSEDISFEIRPAKLTLRKNRPLVSLSFLQEETSQLSTIESTWVPAFIRAGASAFVGPLWSVDPAVDAAFISTFYTRLWMGDALGQAFHTARQMARIAVPESCDWLAYVLYGDPMARPYRPVEGKGYAVVEPIGQDINDPLPPNQSLRFRLTLRRDPPIWHQDRLIEVAEDLAFDNLQVHIVAFGLEVNPTTVDMSRAPNGNYLGWFTLSAPPTMAGEIVPVQVHFADGAEPIHSVTIALHIAAEESE